MKSSGRIVGLMGWALLAAGDGREGIGQVIGLDMVSVQHQIFSGVQVAWGWTDQVPRRLALRQKRY
jgi:hypothetical protein